MTAQLLSLHRARQRKLQQRTQAALPGRVEPVQPLLHAHLEEVAHVVRNRFSLPRGIDDESVIQSLREITLVRGDRDRWQAAFYSTLGLYLSLRMDDFNGAMRDLLQLVPAPID